MKHLLNNKNYTFLGLTLTMTALIKQINDSRIQNLQNIAIQTNLAQLSEDTKNLNSNMENLQNALSIFKKDNSNKFIDPVSEFIKNFQDFLATLDLIHTLNMVHILASMCLFFTLLSMVTIYYGDYLIQYFRLETKYPKLAKWIKIRRQLQHYSLMWNMFLAFILILTIFTLNIWMFIVL